MVTVKKYGNRRLYDTDDSRYVTLGEIADKIRGGADVRVVDAKTNEDLTGELLTQIIFEDRETARLLPVTLLVQLIRMGDDALAEFLSRYVGWALEVYLQARRGVQMNPLANAAFGALSPFANVFGGFSRAEPAPPPPPSSSDDVAELRRELDELKKSLRRSRR